ncbi:hypothetical protein B1759_15820 [Rubrivirga sp. SAORIC476]|uniref:hypothetical protein n=1 Tax=Rubrivirga sp. SAORIC476 TaxID=1961794 RepID=UPI000BA8EAFD|nr:hypothetical protein [Rubrivirga sp. SAORIC476]PAP78905.1 hypothetical protein B1759_15820 [Rubrivirga sp. SAORIC476]
MPGPGDFCHGCNRLLCQCQPEPEYDHHFEASYEAGYEACLADGYCERPMTEWVYRTGSRVTWDATERRLVHHMTPLRFAELTWRAHHTSRWAYARWFERQYGLDLKAYLVGYDDAGAGLPSAVCDERAYARAEAALDAYEPVPDFEEEPEAIPLSPEAVGADDWMPF